MPIIYHDFARVLEIIFSFLRKGNEEKSEVKVYYLWISTDAYGSR
jgi:hypothetical protein